MAMDSILNCTYADRFLDKSGFNYTVNSKKNEEIRTERAVIKAVLNGAIACIAAAIFSTFGLIPLAGLTFTLGIALGAATFAVASDEDIPAAMARQARDVAAEAIHSVVDGFFGLFR